MSGRRRRLRSWSYVLLLSSLLPAAVSAAPRVRVEGSDTIGGGLGIALGEEFHAIHPDVDVEWEGLGSSTAFVGLFDGSADLGASSRPVSESELAEARRLGVRLREFVIAYDGMAVFVHPSNRLPSLTVQELSDIFRGRIRNFRELGGDDRPIRLLARPSYSGTHVFFRDKVVRKGNSKGSEDFAPDTEWIEHTADIVRRVAEDPSAISFGGMAYLRPSVRALPVSYARGQPAVESRPETVRNGTYPIFRQLLIYSRDQPSEASQRLLDFIASRAGQRIVAEVGFVPLESFTVRTVSKGAEPPRPAAAAVAKVPATSVQAAVPAAASNGPGVVELPPTRRIYFRSGSAALEDQGLETLAEVSEELRQGAWRVVVVGHTDSSGPRAANERLSQSRAAAVRARLLAAGFGEDRVAIEAAASDKPAATNDSVHGRRSNRRVDVVFTR